MILNNKTSQKKSEERHFDTFALLSSLDVKFVNNYQKNTTRFNTHYKSSAIIATDL
jgi:hypothetical protein